MDADTIRVRAPTKVVFLCGGALSPDDMPATMLRDAFFRALRNDPRDYQIALAESADPLTSDAGYKDLLSFESDIAQVVGVILLFAESPGSLAELGAFAALKTVAPSLIAVIDDHYYNQVSFIRNGPVKFLEEHYGDEWIHVLERVEISTEAGLDQHKLAANLRDAVENRLRSRSKWSAFDKNNDGHVILLITGLCHEIGAVTQTEIRTHLQHFGVDEPRMANFLYCAMLLGWIKKIRKGNHIFYVGVTDGNAIDYNLNTTRSYRDKLRWRTDIRTYWQANDPTRIRAIAEALR